MGFLKSSFSQFDPSIIPKGLFLPNTGCESERLEEALEKSPRDFYDVGCGRRQVRKGYRPQMLIDKECFARTHWITIDAFGGYLGSTTPFNRLVDAHHNGGILLHKELDQ
jgi:hypothetical protein